MIEKENWFSSEHLPAYYKYVDAQILHQRKNIFIYTYNLS